jgi:hypothetical protein
VNVTLTAIMNARKKQRRERTQRANRLTK